MNNPIGPHLPSHIPLAPASVPASRDGRSGRDRDEFDQLLQAMTGAQAQQPADFLGAGSAAAGPSNSAAAVFNANGFFQPPDGWQVARDSSCGQWHNLDDLSAAQLPFNAPADIRSVHDLRELTQQIRVWVREMVAALRSRPAVDRPQIFHLRPTSLAALPLQPGSSTKDAAPGTIKSPATSVADRVEAQQMCGGRLSDLRFAIEEHSIAVIGRLDELAEDEEERLAGMLAGLLAEHGLGLHQLTINGQPLTLPSSRS